MSEFFDDRLAALRQRFRERACAEAARLEAIALELDAGTPGGALHADIKRIAHSLAGAGGTFGFGAISACAAELEEFVSDLPNSPELAGACRALTLEIERTVLINAGVRT